MKILYVSNGFPPERWAGTETYTAALASEMTRRGGDVQVLCAGTWDHGPRHYNGFVDSSHEGIPVRRVNLNWQRSPSPFAHLYDNPAVAHVLTQFLREWQPDVVHVTSCETLSASVLRVVKQHGLPLLLSLTDFWFLCPKIQLLTSEGENCDGRTTAWECTTCLARESKAYRWTRRVLSDAGTQVVLSAVSRADALTRLPGLRGMFGDMDARKTLLRQALSWPDVRMTASPFVRRMFIDNGVDLPIAVRPYGNDLSWLADYPGKTPSATVRLGFVGQIVWFKGVHVLLDAVRRLRGDFGHRFELRLFGNPDQFPDYGARMKALAEDLPNVQFKGVYQHDDLARVLSEIDVLVVPSLWYDFPIAMHEALASGAPIVATDLGGMAETVIPERNGLLFAKGDAAALAAQLQRLIESPELLQRLRGGIEPVKTVEDDAAELEGLYRDSMARVRAAGVP